MEEIWYVFFIFYELYIRILSRIATTSKMAVDVGNKFVLEINRLLLPN